MPKKTRTKSARRAATAKKSAKSKRERTKAKLGSIPKRPDAERRLRQASKAARVFKVLELIQGRGRWNAEAIAEELDWDVRTIYRDLNALELAGVPWYFDRQQGCYRVRPWYHFPAINLTPDELLDQATATAVTSVPGLKVGSGTQATTAKMVVGSSDEKARLLADAQQLVTALDLKLADHSQHQDIIRTVQWALVEQKQLSGKYESPYHDKPVKLTLHPYRLCLTGQAWYLIARAADSEQPKTYRVARFASLRAIEKPATVSEDFDLKDYFGNAWSVYRGRETYDVQIEFTKEAARLVTEITWHHTQEIKKRYKDGRIVLAFRVDGLEEIVWWVLGWSGRAKVLGPEKLRQMVVEQLETALAMNER